MIISMIAALSENRVIGVQGQLPWHIPEDLARFKAITMGHVVVMGRKTFEGIGHPLPGRTNIVLSRSRTSIPGCLVAASLGEAIATAAAEEEIFICGGAEIFREALPLSTRLYLTMVHQQYQGDAFFPELPETFLEVHREELPGATPPCSLVIYEKVEQAEPADDADNLCRKGVTALQRDLNYLARSCFEQAAQLKNSPEISSYLALSIAQSSGAPMIALKLAQDAVERQPDHPTLYLNLGRVQILVGRTEAALASFRTGVHLGGGPEFLAELERHGAKNSPAAPSLPTVPPLKKYLEPLLRRCKIRWPGES